MYDGVLTVAFLATVDLDVADAGTDGTETSLVWSVETETERGGYLSTKGRFLSSSE